MHRPTSTFYVEGDEEQELLIYSKWTSDIVTACLGALKSRGGGRQERERDVQPRKEDLIVQNNILNRIYSRWCLCMWLGWSGKALNLIWWNTKYGKTFKSEIVYKDSRIAEVQYRNTIQIINAIHKHSISQCMADRCLFFDVHLMNTYIGVCGHWRHKECSLWLDITVCISYSPQEASLEESSIGHAINFIYH